MADKRLTLSEQIKRYEQLDDGEIQTMLYELEDEVIDDIGFRWHSQRSKRMQDRHLDMYHDILKLARAINDSMSSTQIRDVAFPSDFKLLSIRLRM